MNGKSLKTIILDNNKNMGANGLDGFAQCMLLYNTPNV